jgi:hypothetical protein
MRVRGGLRWRNEKSHTRGVNECNRDVSTATVDTDKWRRPDNQCFASVRHALNLASLPHRAA